MTPSLLPTGAPARTIVETLRDWSALTPQRTALSVLHDGERVERTVSYGELHDAACSVARALQRRAERGARVVILLPNGFEFVSAFYGCLLAGMVAVPAYHPLQPRKVAQWKKLESIVDNCGAALIVAPPKSLDLLATMKDTEGLFARCALASHEMLQAEGRAHGAALPQPAAEDLAFLQYTSGSTGTPKGVMLTHANIMANQRVIATLMGHSAETRVVSWLPLYHDMGLSAVLQMGSVGSSLVLMSPVDFVQKPLRWMTALSQHRATTSGGPNFAYALAAAALRTPEAQQARLDLSAWNLAFCGAEPIQRATVTEFVAAAAPHGFAPGAFFPCYGMAEVTVMITGETKGAGVHYLDVDAAALEHGRVQPVAAGAHGTGKSLVGCGACTEGHELLVVGADGAPVPAPNRVGEIWIRGDSVGAGYFGNETASRETFGAVPVGGCGGSYLRTGDLGAVVDGQLYVTGRVKDMLIIRGRNVYPQDVEECVQDAVPALRRGAGAAVSVTVDGEERLVVVQEVGRSQRRQMDEADVLRRVVVAINEDFGLTPHQVVLVEPATIEKTSSGKVARALCRQAFLAGALRSVARWSDGTEAPAVPAVPATQAPAPTHAAGEPALQREIERRITQVVATFLKRAPHEVPRTKAWAELGFDSMSAVQLGMEVQRATGLAMEATVLWDCANIAELAEQLALQPGAAQALGAVPAAEAAAPLPQPAPTGTPAPQPGARDAVALAELSEAQAEALLLKELDA